LPLATLLAVLVWGATFFTSRYVAVASIAAAVALPLAALWRPGMGFYFWFAVVVGALTIVRHRTNIQRLMAGTENRFERKKKPTA
jgi:acyl phosphate:glycerol-3-phosphate acyltransferase